MKLRDIEGNVFEITGNKKSLNDDEYDLFEGYQNGKYTVLDVCVGKDVDSMKHRQHYFSLITFTKFAHLFFSLESITHGKQKVIVFFVKLPKNSIDSKEVQNRWRLSKHTISVNELTD